MEPMDLDEDSIGETPKRFTRSLSTAPSIYSYGTGSAPCFSPIAPASSLWTQRPQHVLVPALSSSTSISRPESHYARNCDSPKTIVAKGSVVPFEWSNPFARSSAASEIHEREGTPMQGFRSSSFTYRPGSPSDGGLGSPGSSGSDMDVGQCSPSPSWDRVISALGSISVFRSNSEMDHSTVGRQGQDERQATADAGKEVERDPVGQQGRSSWEPALTTVQAAISFKRRRPEKKASSPKPKSAVSNSNSEIQLPGKETHKFGNGNGRRASKHEAKSKKTGLHNDALTDTGGKSACQKCCKFFTLLIFLAVLGLALLIKRQASDRHERFAKMDAELLKNEMESRLFGQHIAMQVVPDEVQSYLESFQRQMKKCNSEDCHSLPPLVLSFHGWTGVGKNFVSDIISSVFLLKTVTKFLIPYHFPHAHLDSINEKQIEEWVLSNVTEYLVNFFVFDEMDKASPGVVQGLQNVVSKLKSSSLRHSPTIFLLLSNSLGSEINRLLFQSMVDGRQRESITADDFADLLRNCNDEWCKWLHASSVTARVPFLPLERQHVIQCIRRDLVSKKLSTDAAIIARVLKELTFTVIASGHQFSQTGCKRVADKVNYVTFDSE